MVSWRTAQVAFLLIAALVFALTVTGWITQYKSVWLLYALASTTVGVTLFALWLVSVLLKREDAKAEGKK